VPDPRWLGKIISIEGRYYAHYRQRVRCDAAGYGYGWEDFLDRLAALLAGDDPDRASWEESQRVLKPLWDAALG
jgi:hypothetical protein